MKTVGIICEYNPLHLGHQKQINRIRQEFGEDTAIVCAMSGNFVQRGSPAIMDKSVRAQAAVACGADLVLELPVTVALSSAEGFAAGGVRVLAPVCDTLCFGAETADAQRLLSAAEALLKPEFSVLLREELETGKSFTAIICGNDLMAMGAMKALMERGIRVPEDVSVMGFDGVAMGKFWSPSLTTMSVDKATFGRRAFDLLYSNIVNETTGYYKNKLTLVRGQSTGPRTR